MPKRKHNKHLPKNMTYKHGTYYYRPSSKKWINLGVDLKTALAKYADIITSSVESHRLTDLLDKFFKDTRLSLAEATIATEKTCLKNLKFAFEDFNVDELTPKDIYTYMVDRAKSNQRGANQDRQFLASAYKYFVQLGIINYNPVREITPFPENVRPILLEMDTIWKFYRICPPMIRLMIEAAYSLLLSRKEILSLKMSDIREEGLYLKGRKKTGNFCIRYQAAPMANAFIKKIQRYRKWYYPALDSMFISPQGQPYTVAGFTSAWARLMIKAQKLNLLQESFGIGDIRSKAITDKANKDGRDQASQSAGHATTAVTMRHYWRGRKMRDAAH